MQVHSDMVRTVAFVNIRQSNGQLVPKGTAFFTGHLDRKTAKFRLYVVTAKHVLDMIRERTAADAIVLTFNGKEGKEEREFPLSAWHFHPGRDGEVVDVAVARFDYQLPDLSRPHVTNPNEIRCWMPENIFTVSVSSRAHILPGHEVGLTGLFVHHQGSEKNIPIIRVGSIAALPQEPIRTKMGLMSAFLVEVRSLGGLSGSPVFATGSDTRFGLIGLVHGHFDQRSSDPDGVSEDARAAFQEERINAGIAIVVPADRIRETLRPLIDEDFGMSMAPAGGHP
jgi:hypothetical protein